VKYDFSISGNMLQLKLEGDIDLYNVFELKDMLLEKLSENPSHLIIDLSETNYIDSAGIGWLVELKKLIEKTGKDYKVKNIPDEIFELFKTTSLDKILKDNLELT